MPAPIVQTTTRLLRIVAGILVILAGILLLVLPGPGLLVIIAGLAILGVKMKWLDRLLNRIRNRKDSPPGAVGSGHVDSDPEPPQ